MNFLHYLKAWLPYLPPLLLGLLGLLLSPLLLISWGYLTLWHLWFKQSEATHKQRRSWPN
jgi:hypothetical protein